MTSKDESRLAVGCRRVLYFGPSRQAFVELVEAMAPAVGFQWLAEGEARFSADGIDYQWLPAYGPEATLGHLRDLYVSLVLLDLRQAPGESAEHLARARTLLDLLDDPVDIEARYGFHRIVALVSGPTVRAGDELLIELGRRGIHHVVREREAAGVAQDVFRRVVQVLGARRRGATALCAAGGGITGIFFEQGVLKCLDDVLPSGALQNIDMFCGISAGAVVTSLLRVGYSVDELMAAIAGVEGGRIPPMDLSLVKLGHLNLPDVQRRLQLGARAAVTGAWDVVRHRRRPDANSLFLGLTALIGAPFRSDRFGDLLKEGFTAPGATNDFRDLERSLFIGASDQDAKRHVIFGSEGYDHVPIHLAVQASLSINPAFSAVPIEGRFYEDGAVTRTNNFTEVIRRGADLVFSLDPFVPYVSRDVGSVNSRGMLYNIDQDVRTLSFTRFEYTRDWALRQHPEVSSYTFLPSNRIRGLLSLNPMDHRPFLPIWKGAYLSTLARIQVLCHRLRGDLDAHGLGLELARAEAVAARLEATSSPTFADFYPDGRVEIPRPALALERRPQRVASARFSDDSPWR